MYFVCVTTLVLKVGCVKNEREEEEDEEMILRFYGSMAEQIVSSFV